MSDDALNADNGSALSIAVQVGIPTLLTGAPGIGKSAAIRALAKAHGLACETVIASIRDPTDFAGLPVPCDDGTVKLAAPAWAQRLSRAGKGVLFLDEISTAPPAVQAALLRVVLERTVGDLALPDGVSVIAAANPPEQAAGGWDLTPPLANRFVHLDWDALSADQWGQALMSNEWPTPNGVTPVPPDYYARDNRMRAMVAGFLGARRQLLLMVPNNESSAGKAWPSPRTWEYAARLLTAARVVGAGYDVEALLINGCVGPGPGVEFLTWAKEANLPDPETLLAKPASYVHPNRQDVAFAVLTSVVDAAVTRPERGRIVAAWKILEIAAGPGHGADVGALAAKRLTATTVKVKGALDDARTSIRAYMPILKDAGLMS